MKRTLILAYGIAAYAVFFGTFLYSIWFVYTMDDASAGAGAPRLERIAIDAVLLTVFALQHSIMARQWFKRAWTQVVPKEAERSTYVLFASLALLLLITFWRPLTTTIWEVQSPAGVALLRGMFVLGWLLVLTSTFLIDHFDLFGLKQVWLFFNGRKYEHPKFKTPGPYRLVRHPIYLGFILAFWGAPHMTAGHLFFAVMTTAYILVAIQLEEHDMITFHGEQYRRYKQAVSMLLPFRRKSA
jgi:protein-S-isoprenylcysteine O-methyltransferase Ste14